MGTIELAQAMNRRHFLGNARLGLGALALGSLSGQASVSEAAVAPVAAERTQRPHFTPKAKRVIYLFQSGAPSQFETLDYKPKLQAMRAELGKLDVDVAARQRAIDESWSRVAKAKQALEEIRQLVSQ